MARSAAGLGVAAGISANPVSPVQHLGSKLGYLATSCRNAVAGGSFTTTARGTGVSRRALRNDELKGPDKALNDLTRMISAAPAECACSR